MVCQYIDGLLQGPDMVLNTLLLRGSCVSSFTLCERVIFEQKPPTISEESIKNKSKKIGMFQKPKCPKRIKFSKKYEGFKNLRKYLKLSKYFKKLESI